MPRIAIVDDHPTLRMGLRTRIELEPDLEVCAEAEDIGDALRKIAETRPDLALVDISLRDGSGIDLIERLLSRYAKLPVLVHSMYDEKVYAERALRAGARGYLTKAVDPDAVVTAIRRVLAGQLAFSADVSERMLQRAGPRSVGSPDGPAEAGLTDRELQVYRQIGSGLTTREIATKLRLGVSTIETYRKRIREKLQIPSSAELARRAAQWSLENG